MKRMMLLIVAMGVLLNCNFATAAPVQEGKDLVIYDQPKELKRYENIFDPSVKDGDIDPKIAQSIADGKLPKHKKKIGLAPPVEKVMFWNFPAKLAFGDSNYVFSLNKEGKIAKEKAPHEQVVSEVMIFDAAWRILPIFSILVIPFLGNSFFRVALGVLGIGPGLIVNGLLVAFTGWEKAAMTEYSLLIASTLIASLFIQVIIKLLRKQSVQEKTQDETMMSVA